MIEFFSAPMIIIYAILFGVTMKLADCFNEHGFKWFKGDAIIFGILFGIFGGLLIMSNSFLTNLFLALLMINLLRFRIDYFNHGIAGTLMFLSFFLVMDNFHWPYFLYFFLSFGIFGVTMDVILPKIKSFKRTKKVFEFRFFYFLFSFLFSVYTGVWIVFFSISIFQISYNLTSSYAKKSKNYKR